MKNKILTLLTILPLLVTAQKPRYINPMDIPMVLSASFCELRPNHFHAGLDITTLGEIGVNVKSVADGWVSRIRVSPYGYGHALYITHYDGYTTLYGHLSGYAPKIEQVISSEQYRLQSFEVDYYPKPDEIKVKSGEVVAFSGNTGGSGGPHLHFEVRDTESEDALNPLAFIAPIEDTNPPSIHGVKVFVLENDSQVDGACANKYYSLKNISNRTIKAFGHIGLGIDANDFFSVGGRPCGLVEISLFDDTTLVFKSHINRMPFDKSRYINSFIDYAEYQNTNRYVQKCFVEPNNQLDIILEHQEIYIAPGETHHFKYLLKDFVGNTSVLNFNIKGDSSAINTPITNSGYFVEWAREWVIDTLDIEIDIPHGTFYKNEFINITCDTSHYFHRPIYHIGNYQIPLQKSIQLNIPIPDNIKANIGTKFSSKQIFIAKTGLKNTLGYVGGEYNNGYITAQTRTLGNFIIATDTIAPKVTMRSGASLWQNSNIVIDISDNLSGIDKYNIYIDGKWKLFEYDYKNTCLIANVAKLKLEQGNHTLVAKIEDHCGNVKQIEWKFKIR